MPSLHRLTDSTDLTYCVVNEALFDINQRQLKIAHPGFSDLNRVRPAFLTRCRPLLLIKILSTSFVDRRPRHVRGLDGFCGSRASLTGAFRYQRGNNEQDGLTSVVAIVTVTFESW